MNNCCLKRDSKGWCDSIDEFNHLNRKINKQLNDMIVLRNRNVDEQKSHWDKYFNKVNTLFENREDNTKE